jgi:hypothetical protein
LFLRALFLACKSSPWLCYLVFPRTLHPSEYLFPPLIAIVSLTMMMMISRCPDTVLFGDAGRIRRMTKRTPSTNDGRHDNLSICIFLLPVLVCIWGGDLIDLMFGPIYFPTSLLFSSSWCHPYLTPLMCDVTFRGDERLWYLFIYLMWRRWPYMIYFSSWWTVWWWLLLVLSPSRRYERGLIMDEGLERWRLWCYLDCLWYLQLCM